MTAGGPTSAKHVFRWDLDKTYLRTEFDTVGDLIKTAFESARDKQAVPGAPALLRSLGQTPEHRICIISGSPKQMRRVLAAKLALDGVRYDEFVLKDNLRNLLRGRFRAMRSQVPYKLPALLASRAGLFGTPPETLFGDDAESDAIIYSLYADLISGRVDADELPRILAAARAYDDQIEHAVGLLSRIVSADSARRIIIHLDRRSATGAFAVFGPRLVPVYNYFQAALVLYADAVLTARQVLFIALEMLDDPDYELGTLANSLQDMLLRGRLERDVALRLSGECEQAAREGALSDRPDLPPFDDIAAAFIGRVRALGDIRSAPPPSGQLDYVNLVDRDHGRRRSQPR